MRNLRLLLVIIGATLLTGQVFGQDEPAVDDKYKNVPKRFREQQDKYESGEYLFPAKPKSNWSVGARGGFAFISGDMAIQPGYVFGMDVRKSLGHAFALRLQGSYGQTQGINYKAAKGYSLGSDANPWKRIYGTAPNGPSIFYNFQSTFMDASMQAVLTVNNINFYKEQANWGLFFSAGFGLVGYDTKIDALDQLEVPYDFKEINRTLDPNQNNLKSESRRDILNQLRGLLDGEYETPAEQESDVASFKLGEETFKINPAFTGSMGFRYRMGRRIEVEVEHRFSITNDDLLDGQRWEETGTLTRDFDLLQQTSVGLHFRLGKGEEALWWSNPLTTIYNDVRDAKTIAQRLTADTDNDGIPDLYDKEPDTPTGQPVDAQGRTLDSDGDGFPDPVDDDPYTPRNCPVDGRGVALDSDADGVPDCYDKEPNSAAGTLVDAKGITIGGNLGSGSRIPGMSGGMGTGELICILPIIYFETDRDEVKPEFYPELYYIAQVLKSNPGVKIKATGHADVRSSNTYNEELSRRRVTNTVEFLVETYNISSDRFIMEFKGEEANQIPGLPENNTSDKKVEPLHSANRRVEFECVQ